MTTSTESDTVLEELCAANGLNLSDFKSAQFKINENVKRIEMFFTGYHAIMHLEKFPNLTILKIVAQELKQISGLETCLNLIELWIVECKISKIDGLKNCRNLKKLYLYSNQLSRIQNLDHINLELLWLNDNKISAIEGIKHMSELIDLNLAKNSISNIGDSLNSLKNLEVLNLSSNSIKKFEEVNNLQNLPRLKHLCFKDPQYGQNPITILCNYSLYVIYFLPGLMSLDTFPISQKTVKELADSTINKKKLWYFMKLTTTERELNEMIERLDAIAFRECSQFNSQAFSYNCKIKDIKKELFLMSLGKDVNNTSWKEKEAQLKVLEEKLAEVNKNIQIIETQRKKALDIVNCNMKLKKRCIFMELENGGNIRFEFYVNGANGLNANVTSEAWFKSCQELIVSRFCASDYVSKAINGVRVNKVIRVTNRVLLAKYEEMFLADVDEADYLNNKPSIRKKIDYLMYCWRPKLGTQEEELFDIIKNGFKNGSEYEKQGYEQAIPFSNSLSISDFYRIEAFKNAQKTRVTNNLVFKHGYALLCKVYTNKFVQSINEPIIPENYKDTIGVKRAFKFENLSQNKTSIHSLAMTQELFEAQRSCECKPKQTEYFLFKKEYAVPEYIIQYEYIYKHHVDDAFDKELPNLESNLNRFKTENTVTTTTEIETESKLEHKLEDSLLSEIERQIPRLEEDIDLRSLNISSLVELNLHNVGLTSLDIEPVRSLRFVKKLTISFNKLKSLKELTNLNSLEYLDASYNQIENLHGLKSVTKISYLDISHNQLSEIISLCNTLKQHFPTLTYLDLTNNLIKKTNKLRSLALYSLRSLVHYNKEKLNEAEKEFSDNKSRLNKESIKKHAYFLNAKPRSLRYYFVSELCNLETADNLERANNGTGGETESNLNENSTTSFDSDIELVSREANSLFSKITTLNLDSQSLYRLSNIDYLVNLKWASFNNNFLTKLEGIEKCFKLEELSVENNLIQSLSGLENLEQLRKLNVSNNELTILEDSSNKNFWELNNLNRLTYLSVANNYLTSLKFLLNLPSLIELYASFNRLRNLREIFHLKSLNGLVILDLSSNPMCFSTHHNETNSKYRLFLIYHLKTLKSLDGFTIETSEINEARESFGGKLTSDYIAEKFAHHRLSELRALEFPNSAIRVVDLGPTPQLIAEQFENLRSLNLENNFLTSFSGLVYLRNLKLLCLNNNKIESIFPKSKPIMVGHLGLEQILPNLEVLHLAYNGISDLILLQVGRLTSLKALFLQGNEITKIEGLESLRDLRELVLDKNKIKQIGELSFVGQSQRLIELHIEENRLRDLVNIQTLRNLQKLYAANNKINEFTDIEKLLDLGHLHEISLINNPISRRPHYRITVVYRLRRVRVLDLSEITDEDRLKAEIYFTEQMQQQQLQQQIYFNGGIIQTTTNPQIIATQIPGMVSINQLDTAQYFATHQNSSSPRLKPIAPTLDKQLINNNNNGQQQQQMQLNNNTGGSIGTTSTKKTTTRPQNYQQTRFRNQLN